jgi:hypothetical protein
MAVVTAGASVTKPCFASAHPKIAFKAVDGGHPSGECITVSPWQLDSVRSLKNPYAQRIIRFDKRDDCIA